MRDGLEFLRGKSLAFEFSSKEGQYFRSEMEEGEGGGSGIDSCLHHRCK